MACLYPGWTHNNSIHTSLDENQQQHLWPTMENTSTSFPRTARWITNHGYHTLDKNSRNSRILSLFIKTKTVETVEFFLFLFLLSQPIEFALRSFYICLDKKTSCHLPPSEVWSLKRRSIETLTLTSLSLVWDSCKQRHFICNTLNISSSSLNLSSCYFCLVVYLTW
jgi:hypothetical protein